MPQLTVVAGPNGSGKSTYTESAAKEFTLPPMDPDALPGSRIAAGRTAILKIRAALASLEPIVLETTLSGRFALDTMRLARQSGYETELIFISTTNVEINIQRVALRVAEGGHDVPEVDIRRRFKRSLTNLSAAIALANRTLIFDNSNAAPELLTIIENKQRHDTTTALPEWVYQYALAQEST